MSDDIKALIDAMQCVLADVQDTEKNHTRNAGTDYNCRQWFVEHGGTALAALERLSGRVTVEDDAFLELIADGMAEADRAMRKFPQPNYVISKIAEEAGEVVKAAIHHAEDRETAENVIGEMRQLIAMLYRLCVEGDQVHGMGPLIPTGGGDGT